MERFVLQTSAEEIEEYFGVSVKSKSKIEPTFNAAPGYVVPVIFNESGEKKIERCIWDPQSPSTFLVDFLQQSNSASILIKHTGILPISGFYVWKKTVSDPLPFYVRIHSQTILGIPCIFTDNGANRKQFSVFTRSANVLLTPLDNSMPCILKPEHFDSWLLHQATDIVESGFDWNTMIPEMTVYRVPNLVNDLSNNRPELIQPIPKLRDED